MVEVDTTIKQVPTILQSIERNLAGSAEGGQVEVESLLQQLLEALLLVRGYYNQHGNPRSRERRITLYAAVCHAEDDVDRILRALILEENGREAAARLPTALVAVQQAWHALR